MVEICNKDKEVLKLARDIYGDKNQIIVAMEELNELGAAIAKFPRYEDEEKALQLTREKVLDEVADVYIVLENVKAIYSLNDELVIQRTRKKVARLMNWLAKSDSFEQTTCDREVPESVD